MSEARSHHEVRRERTRIASAGPPSATDVLRVIARKARGARSGDRRAAARFRLLSRIARVLVPHYVMTAPEKTWFRDERFFRDFYAFEEEHDQTADRRYTLRQLLALVDHIPGDTAECGVYRGTGSWFICDHFRHTDRTHHAFDSFEGLSEPGRDDGSFWHAGDLRAAEDVVREALRPFRARVYRGWFPERFAEVADRTFAFVHIDVDLYEPTRCALEFFYPRVAPGGIILMDDYGQTTCPGATLAAEEYMAERPETILLFTTGQGIIVKVPSGV